MPQAIIAAAQAVGAWYASLGPVAQAAVQVAASAATSVAVNAIMQGNRPSPQGGMNQTNLSSDAPRRLQIGSRNNGGVIVDIQTGGNKNSRGFMVFYLGEGPMGALKRIWSGGNRVYNGTINHGVTTQLTEFDSPDARVYVTYYDGRPGQTYHTNWQFTGQTPASKWPSTRVGTGCAYVVVEVRWDPDTLPTLPSFSFEVEGAKMYDRRLDTTAGGSGSQRLTDPSTWTVSTNPAVALDHFMLGRYLTASDKKPVFGIGLDPSDVPYDKFEALADLCDESVSLNGGGTQKRYEVNGFIESDEPFREVILKLTKAMNARPADFGGKVSVVDGEASASVMTITDGMMIEGVPEVYTPKRPRTELPGSVIGTYQDLANNYYPVEYPEIRDSAWETTNGSVLSSHRYDLEHETSSERAQRLATLYAQRQYRQATLSGTYSLAALELEDGDWFTRKSSKFNLGSSTSPYANYAETLKAYKDAGEALWFDFNDTTSMRVERDGSGGYPGPNSLVGLVVDTSACNGMPLEDYMELQPELVTNGTFDSDTAWTKGTNASISGGVATLNVVGGAFTYISQPISFTEGAWYVVTLTLNGNAGNNVRVLDDGGNAGALTSPANDITLTGSSQQVEYIFQANANSDEIQISRSGTGDWSFTVDNVSVKELPGYCFTSSSDAARPTLQHDGSRYYLDFDTTHDLQAPGSDMSSLGYEVSRGTFAKNMVQNRGLHIWFAPDVASLYIVASNDGSPDTALSAFAGGNIGYDTSADFGLYMDGVETTFLNRDEAHDAVRGLNKTVWADGVDTATYAAWTNYNWTIGSEYNSTWAMDGRVYNWLYINDRLSEDEIAQVSSYMSGDADVTDYKVFEVVGSPAIDYDNLTVSLFAREVNPGDAAWDNSGVVTPVDPDVDDDQLPVISLTVPTISVSVVSYTGNSTTWSFLEATNDNYDTDPNNIEIEIRLDAGGATPTGETRRAYIPYGEETVDLSGLIPGAGYVIRARAYLENKFSDWTSWSSFTSGADFVSSGIVGQGALATQERASRRKYTNTFTGESGTGFGGANGISSTYVDCAQLTLDVVAGESVELEGAVDFDYLSFENPTNADRITIYGKLLRGTDVISEGFNVGIFNISGADALSFVPGLSFNQIDFPPSTGNVTYKLQLRSDADPKSPNNRSFTFKSGVGNYFKATTYESGSNETVLQNTYTANLASSLGRMTCSSAATMPYSGIIGQASNTLGAATLSSAATITATDVTPDAINWQDAVGLAVAQSSDETVSGINTTISIYAQKTSETGGGGTWQYRINQGSWTNVTNGSGGAFTVSNGDDVQWQLSSGTPHIIAFQIKNLSDSSAVLDTCTLEIEEFEL